MMLLNVNVNERKKVKKLDAMIARAAVNALRKSALREIDRILERLNNKENTEILNLMNSGITVDLKTLKKYTLTQVKKQLGKQ